jgi:hypothetical protein
VSRGLFRVEIRIQYANGAVGEAHIVQEHLVTVKEVRQCLDRAAKLAESLREEPAIEETAPAWRPSVVGDRGRT